MIKKGSKVKYKGERGEATGVVKEIYRSPVKINFEGREISAEASMDNPAYVIERADNSQTLRPGSEVSEI